LKQASIARQASAEAGAALARANANELALRDQRDQADSARHSAFVAEGQARIKSEEAVAQTKRADTAAARAAAVQEFLARELLGMADPAARTRGDDPLQGTNSVTFSPDTTIKEVLDRASRNIGSRFEKQPLVEAEIRE